MKEIPIYHQGVVLQGLGYQSQAVAAQADGGQAVVDQVVPVQSLVVALPPRDAASPSPLALAVVS